MAGEGADKVTPDQQLSACSYFGVEVRAAREGRKLGQRRLAEGTGYSVAYVSKVENGVLMPSERFAERCDVVFGTGGLFARLRRRINETEAPSWAVNYFKLEKKADRILDWSVHCLNGLVQTADYAREIIRAGNPHDANETIERMTKGRTNRPEYAFSRDPQPCFWTVIYEACLRSCVGGPRVMKSQLDHLVELAQRPKIDIQVMPFSTGSAAAHSPAFTLMSFADGSPGALWADGPTGGRLYQNAETVSSVTDMHERLRAHALSPEDSTEFIRTVSKEL
ncbi:helix-turn-helix domain-containing protein [Streptomyces johnsoniae]|uniref:Helix-turn-helix transcriptional regulator n=1 Tax=Streptomyces johnsoniae TaxID=3075532 RepID=A0ABU2RY84_9ACTN|nr:helix-turn-helix transcriptional regulator [Streptomyces sp. DSM 41886]MDT0441702.1 helix-turn-helix transcriptional regulator [Streptomyces sp. DSM 41886]